VTFPPIALGGVLAAAVVGFVIGGVWFAPQTFGKAWLRVQAISDQDAAKTQGVGVALAFVATLATAYVLGLFVRFAGATTPVEGATIGLLAWLAFAVAIHLPAANLERKPEKFLIDIGHKLAVYVVMGAILAIWA